MKKGKKNEAELERVQQEHEYCMRATEQKVSGQASLKVQFILMYFFHLQSTAVKDKLFLAVRKVELL